MVKVFLYSKGYENISPTMILKNEVIPTDIVYTELFNLEVLCRPMHIVCISVHTFACTHFSEGMIVHSFH